MREKISIYVEGLFSDAALTIRNAEVQQEILQHALDGIFLRRLHRTRYPLRRRPAGRKSSPAGPSRLSVWVWPRRFWR